MDIQKTKRKYNSENRKEKSQATRLAILHAAKKLLSANGIRKTTIEQIAKEADVSTPTVYSLFGSKVGIIGQLGQTFVFGERYKSLVRQSASQEDPRESLRLAPTITVTIFEMEMEQMAFLWDGLVVFPEVETLISQLEQQRYERQKFIIERLNQRQFLRPELTVSAGREILWAMTGRELFRKLVKERGWTHSEYKQWLENTLIALLVNS